MYIYEIRLTNGNRPLEVEAENEQQARKKYQNLTGLYTDQLIVRRK